MTDTPEPLVLYECRDRVATITFNRPARLNAFNDDMTREALAAMHRFDLDKDADVAVLTGAGRAFSSGADVQQEAVRTVRAAKLTLSEDFLESARAFVEKRPAGPFKGR